MSLIAHVEKIVTDGYMPSAITSSVYDLKRSKGFAVEAIWTGGDGTINGTFQVQGCLADQATVNQMFNNNTALIPASWWNNVPGASLVVTSASGSQLWNVTDVFYRYIRVIWTPSAGITGTAQVMICSKDQ